ncbi:RNA-directed DNA polymerase, eukaryota, nucleotide-binding alpha-beta plait domain protein [Tanacetum coccineum]
MAASSFRYSRFSNADRVQNISHSIYVTNFPDSVTSRDLWNACSVYGTVVDVFIPLKKSKVGKRFAFVRFVKVHNLVRLVENLCTIWIGRHHLFANQVRYERPQKNHSNPTVIRKDPIRPFVSPTPIQHGYKTGSYVNAVNNPHSVSQGPVLSSAPALVLDDECLIDRDLSKHLMGKVKEFSSIPNLYTIFRDEGFPDVKLTYLGGLWVMIECGNQITKDNMIKHKGVLSWFLDLLNANNDFVSDERIVWVDLEGIPLNAWSRETFIRIGKLWGETLILENDIDNSFGRKRICIKTKHHVSILESFKIIVKGRVYMIRAKELFTWEPSFLIYKEKEYVSDDEFVRETSNIGSPLILHFIT